MLTLSQIGVLLWCHWSPEPFPDRDIARKAVDTLLEADLIYIDATRGGYTTTARGNVYVEAIRALPLPEERWIMPERRPLTEQEGE